MQSFEIIKGRGGVPKALNGRDHVCGMVFFVPTASYGTLKANQKQCVVGSKEDVETIFPEGDTNNDAKVMRYHLMEIYRMNGGAKVWVKAEEMEEGDTTSDLEKVKAVQEYAEGECRQIGVWNCHAKATPEDIKTLQLAATDMEASGNNCSILYCAKIDTTELKSATYSSSGCSNVSMVIAQDMTEGGDAVKLAAELSDVQLGAVGTLTGCVSKAAVNESVAWVAKFDTGFESAGFQDGKKSNEVTSGDKDTLDGKRFIFLVKYDGIAGTYWNDSHTMDEATSDYSSIELERAIDKACRGVRTYMLPYLGSPVYLQDDGTLRRDSLDNLRNVASQALEQMEMQGELSGYAVEINSEQNILQDSTLEVVIKNVAVGVMRHIRIKIGYVTSIE